MGSNAKKKTTMGKLNREQKVREKREEKEARKARRKADGTDGSGLIDVYSEIPRVSERETFEHLDKNVEVLSR